MKSDGKIEELAITIAQQKEKLQEAGVRHLESENKWLAKAKDGKMPVKRYGKGSGK